MGWQHASSRENLAPLGRSQQVPPDCLRGNVKQVVQAPTNQDVHSEYTSPMRFENTLKSGKAIDPRTTSEKK